jgi:hypothetical protein
MRQVLRAHLAGSAGFGLSFSMASKSFPSESVTSPALMLFNATVLSRHRYWTPGRMSKLPGAVNRVLRSLDAEEIHVRERPAFLSPGSTKIYTPVVRLVVILEMTDARDMYRSIIVGVRLVLGDFLSRELPLLGAVCDNDIVRCRGVWVGTLRSVFDESRGHASTPDF